MRVLFRDVMPIKNLGDHKVHFAKRNGLNQPLDVFTKDRRKWKAIRYPAAYFALRVTVLLVAVSCLAGVGFGKDRSPDSLKGTWRLIRYVDTPDGGEPIYAFGREPIGLFIFTPDGHVSINIMRNPPDIHSPTNDPDPDACIPAWYCAYFGTYTVDYERGVWVTHILGGNIPGYLGTEQPRTFKLRGDTLTISESYMAGSQHVRAERMLRRDTR
jgi:Lipocalin-like domain